MLQRNLLYTVVTLGKRLVVIVGQRKAMAIAVKGKQIRWWWSKLKEPPELVSRSNGSPE
jgi:exodeoxyribonuclease V alpha subunit